MGFRQLSGFHLVDISDMSIPSPPEKGVGNGKPGVTVRSEGNRRMPGPEIRTDNPHDIRQHFSNGVVDFWKSVGRHSSGIIQPDELKSNTMDFVP